MRKQYIQLLFFSSLCIQVQLIFFTSLLFPEVAHFGNISEAHLSLSAQNLYLLHRNNITANAELLQYSPSNGELVLEKTDASQNGFSYYWEIQEIQTEIVSFPIRTSQIADLYSTKDSKIIQTTYNKIIFREIQSKITKTAFVSTVDGNVGYATVSQIETGEITIMPNSHHIGNTILSLSPNQRYLCSTDFITGLVSIWDPQNKKLSQQIWLNQTGLSTHCWSPDSSLLYVFGCLSGVIYELNATDSFGVITNISTSVPYFFASFASPVTEELVAIAANQSAMFIIDKVLSNISLIPINFAPVNMKIDPSRKYFTVFSSDDLSLYKIDSPCNSSQFYNVTSRACMGCSAGCEVCDGYTCFSCGAGYEFNKKRTGCIGYSQAAPTTPAFQPGIEISKATFAALNTTINVPGHRRFLSVFFELFSNFDHFVLYIYHNRTYGSNMAVVLQQIHDTIDYRFQIINKQFCRDYLGVDFNSMQDIIDFKASYSFQRYVEIELSGQGFFQSNIQYFFLNIPLILLMLIMYRTAFKLLFNFRISSLLRKFSFWSILILFLLEGNIQFFFFSFTADFLTTFFVNFNQKWFTTASILTGFIFLVLSTFGLLFFYLSHSKRSSQFYENCNGSCASAIYYVLINGVFNILRGIIHRASITLPNLQSLLLFMLELTQAILIIIWWKRAHIFKSPFVTVLFLSGSISRAIFDITLLTQSYIQLETLDYIHISIFLLNVLTFFLSIIEGTIDLMRKLKRIFSNKVKNHEINQSRLFEHHSNVFSKFYAEKSEISSFESSVRENEKSACDFKRKASQKTITFKFCRKNIKATLTIKEFSCKKQNAEKQCADIQSIDLNL